MNKTQAINTIDEELRKADVVSEPMLRARIAAAIQATKRYFSNREITRLRAHFATVHDGDEAMRAALLDGSWVEIESQMRAEESSREDPNVRGTDSGIAYVSESNPYGWKKPEHTLPLDHDRPGEWNAYRQCWNLSAAQRLEYGSRDYKIRGCTRWEVTKNGNQPTIEWDGAEVNVAQALEIRGGSVPPNHEVYGE